MNPILVIGARVLGVVCAMAVLYAVVAAFMAVTDRRRNDAERKAWRERDWQRAVSADPRKSKRATRRGRPGGEAA